MSLPTLRTPHGRLVAIHNGATLAYLTRQRNVVEAARALAVERGLLREDPSLEDATDAEQQLADALRRLGTCP